MRLGSAAEVGRGVSGGEELLDVSTDGLSRARLGRGEFVGVEGEDPGLKSGWEEGGGEIKVQ